MTMTSDSWIHGFQISPFPAFLPSLEIPASSSFRSEAKGKLRAGHLAEHGLDFDLTELGIEAKQSQ